MPITDLLLSGVNLMLLGMGIVFIFLVLLVFSMLAMSRFAQATEQRIKGQTETPAVSPPSHSSDELRGDLVAVITAAVTRYRMSHH
jgi:oxaloacetate decarboxylase gamma subunit